jgi:hypothetical protein
MAAKRRGQPVFPAAISVFERVHANSATLLHRQNDCARLPITSFLKRHKEALESSICPCARVLAEKGNHFGFIQD